MILSSKQSRFCHEYIVDLNGTQAAIRAGYSSKTARHQATRLLTKVHVQSKIKALQEDIAKTTDITIAKTLTELARIAFSDVGDYIEVKNNQLTLKDLTLLTKNQTAAIESIQQTKDGLKFKLYNKPQALELIGKHLGMFDQFKEEKEFDLPPDIDNLDDIDVERYYDQLRKSAS